MGALLQTQLEEILATLDNTPFRPIIEEIYTVLGKIDDFQKTQLLTLLGEAKSTPTEYTVKHQHHAYHERGIGGASGSWYVLMKKNVPILTVGLIKSWETTRDDDADYKGPEIYDFTFGESPKLIEIRDHK